MPVRTCCTYFAGCLWTPVYTIGYKSIIFRNWIGVSVPAPAVSVCHHCPRQFSLSYPCPSTSSVRPLASTKRCEVYKTEWLEMNNVVLKMAHKLVILRWVTLEDEHNRHPLVVWVVDRFITVWITTWPSSSTPPLVAGRNIKSAVHPTIRFQHFFAHGLSRL